jgi:DNA-binding CsgD family transcriptional regulator
MPCKMFKVCAATERCQILAEVERLMGSLPEFSGSLSKRETEIAMWMIAGKTNGEIGTILSLSKRTVETYIHQGMKRLSLTTRNQFMTIAIRDEITKAA